MSDDIKFEHLSDREILIITAQAVNVQSKRLDAHAKDIKALRDHKNWMAGAGAVLAMLFGVHVKGH